MPPPRRAELPDDDGFTLLNTISMTPATARKVNGWCRTQLYDELKGKVQS